MSRRRANPIAFEGIAIEGALIAPDILGRIGALEAGEQAEADYRLGTGVKIRDEIGYAFAIAETLWKRFSQARSAGEGARDVTRFATDLLRQVFGFDSLAPVDPWSRDGRLFPVSLAALGGCVPVVVAPPPSSDARRSGLDESLPLFGDGTRRRSAALLVQEFLNARDDARWGIALDGLTLRILRDNASLTRPAWIEVSLERILDGRLFADFSVLWLLLHESRFGRSGGAPDDSPLERWRARGREEGVKARERLRDGVEAALAVLGDGFLKHPANGALRDALTGGQLDAAGYFQELLRLVYRFIFLFTAEDRGLLHPPEASEAARRLYAEGYSVGRLRERAVRRVAFDRHHDLWDGVRLVAGRLAIGEPRLGLPALAGLFRPGQTPHLDRARLDNRALLTALYRLAWLDDRDSGRIERVNWRDMETEELGSVYESLLELAPRVETGAAGFGFVKGAQAKGNARKTSGSYYTPDALVQLLLDSALDPVIEAAVKDNPGREIAALLALDVIDPACGSGHFLLAAARRIAQRVAQLRSPGAPSAEAYRHALREVVRHCLYGVDRNPLAVELCQLALWIESVEPGKPMAFLGNRIRCGDSLIGVLDLKILADGIPDAAYKPLTGDDKAAAKYFTARNRKERRDRPELPFAGSLAALAKSAEALEAMPEDDVLGLSKKEAAFAQLQASPESWRLRVACDLYIAAFFTPKTVAGFVNKGRGLEPENANTVTVPTTDHVWRRLDGHQLYGPLEATAIETAGRARAFHWPLAFPDVFRKGGFDCVLGNPPWERVKLQEQEFFATRAPEIAAAPNKAARQAMIEALIADGAGDADRRLQADFAFARREAEAASTVARASGRFPLTGVGDVNTYALFAENFAMLRAQHQRARAGIIVPTGIATDATTSRFFGSLVEHALLAKIVSFYEIRRWFPGTQDRKPFCILTIAATPTSQMVFDAMSVADALDRDKVCELTPSQISLVNPNTRTAPVFRSRADAELTARIYERVPVLIDESKGAAGNPWGLSFSTMFHMANDSHHFRTAAQLAKAGGVREGSDWHILPPSRSNDVGPGRWLPLYEAKMIHHFDHRWATYLDAGDDTRDVTPDEKRNAGFEVTPRYWVPAREVHLRTARLPPGLLKALRANDATLIVLALAHVLFFDQLDQDGVRPHRPDPPLWPAWCRFVEAQPFARPISPITLGLAGDNPPLLAPTGPDCLPAVAIDEVTVMGRHGTAWYASDPRLLSGFMQAYEGLSSIVRPTPRLETREAAIAFAEACLERATPTWLMGWRDICRSTDERTTINAAIPAHGLGHKFLLAFSNLDACRRSSLVAIMSSLVFDYVARQKIGGTSFTYFMMKQIACPPASILSDADLAFISSRSLELTFVSRAMAPFAEALGYSGRPFPWNEDRRAVLRAELDAWIARLYGLTRDELRYIVDPAEVMGPDYPSETFRVLKQNEIKRFGEYRTARLVLDAWDRIERGELKE